MSEQNTQDDARRFDLRLIESRMRRGDITPEQYKTYLDALPDDAAHAEPCRVTFASVHGASHRR